MKVIKLSVAIATYNEEANIAACLNSVQSFADEIIVVDGQSQDHTADIARQLGAIVYVVPNQSMFHINKQLSFDHCHGEWILALDADEIVTLELAQEIKTVVMGTHQEMNLSGERLLLAHMGNVAARDGVHYTQTPPINGYFLARKNFFLGNYLMHAGVYPDGVIRLFRRGKGHLPCQSVHEQVVIVGGVSWLRASLVHMADPTLQRYLQRANRYTSLSAQAWQSEHLHSSMRNTIKYMFWRPTSVFLQLFFRHKGFLDGFSGFAWSLLSGLHYPIAYMKFLEMSHHATYEHLN